MPCGRPPLSRRTGYTQRICHRTGIRSLSGDIFFERIQLFGREGFEQRPIEVDGGELYVHLWQSDDWSIQTEQERFAPKVAEGLPELCFSILKTTGQLICIKRGESGYYLSDWDTGDKERNVELADEMNENLGVSPVQRQAMEIGSLAGWDVPGADPKAYEQDALQMGGM